MDAEATKPDPAERGKARARPLHGKLRRAWALEQKCYLGHGACVLLVWAAGVALAVLVLDWLIDLPGPVRSVLLAGLLGLGLWQAYVRHWRWLRRYSARRVGLDVEREYPHLNSLLVSYVDFSDAPAPPGTSEQLRDRVRQEAVAAGRPLKFERIAPVERLRRGLLAAGIVVAVYVGLSVWRPQVMWTFARRMVNPVSRAAYPTKTTVIVLTRDVILPEGGSLTLAARTEGVRPTEGTLRVRGEGRNWEELKVRPNADGRFEYQFGEVYHGFEYAFRLGDDRSAPYEVRVVPAPRVVEATVHVEPPDYTNAEPQEQSSLTLSVPERSTVRWDLVLDKPVVEPELILEVGSREERPVACDADGRTVTVEAPARASSAYRFRWRDREHGFQHEGPKHYLQVRLDHEPGVQIVYPSTDEKATLDKILTVTYEARDDYGVHEATLIYHRNDGAAFREPLLRATEGEEAVGEKYVSRAFERRLTDLVEGLKEGDTVRYYIEVCDAFPGSDGPHREQSKVRRVQVLSAKEYLAHIARRQRELVGQLRPVYRQERVASEKVRDMKGSVEPDLMTPGEPSDD